MAKLEIPIRVYMGELEEVINELKHLQTYKLSERDDAVLINCDDVVKIFADHLRAEILGGSTIGPKRKKGKFIGTEYDGYADGNPVYYEWKCSECGCIFEDEEPTYNFCPNCGADMRGDKHEVN